MHESEKWKWSRSVVFDSSRPHGLQPTRLLHPWDFPGKSTGVECHCLLRHLIYKCLNVYYFQIHIFSCLLKKILFRHKCLKFNISKTELLILPPTLSHIYLTPLSTCSFKKPGAPFCFICPTSSLVLNTENLSTPHYLALPLLYTSIIFPLIFTTAYYHICYLLLLQFYNLLFTHL